MALMTTPQDSHSYFLRSNQLNARLTSPTTMVPSEGGWSETWNEDDELSPLRFNGITWLHDATILTLNLPWQTAKTLPTYRLINRQLQSCGKKGGFFGKFMY